MPKPSKPQWIFPPNNGGRKDAINDAALEIFRSNPVGSLSREIVQNSIDARITDDEPVTVHFQREQWDRTDFPGLQSLEAAFASSKKFWKHDKKTVEFCDNALRLLKQPSISVLKVSDFQTTGLCSYKGDFGSAQSDWDRLTKAQGASGKGGTGLGSYGIGKNAALSCSDLRTVLYSTKTKDKQFAFQGVSNLVTHVDPAQKATQGAGFYGNKSNLSPITSAAEIPPEFLRKHTGTDIFILGFEKTLWQEAIRRAVIDSFLVAIHENKLVIRLGKGKQLETIAKDTLGSLIERLNQQAQQTKNDKEKEELLAIGYRYQALTSKQDKHFFQSKNIFPKVKGSEVELHLLQRDDLPPRGKITRVRNPGMKIFTRQHGSPLSLAGVLIIRGKGLSELLRNTEPPAHDKWDANLAKDPKKANEALKAIRIWTKEQIQTLNVQKNVEADRFEDLSKYLPDYDSEPAPAGKNTPQDKEGEKGAPAKTIYVTSVQTPPAVGEDATPGSNDSDFGGGGGDDEGGGGGDRPGPSPGPTPVPVIPDPDGPVKKFVKVVNDRVFFDQAVGRYRVYAEPCKSGTGFLLLRAIGEEPLGKAEQVKIKEFWLSGAGQAKPPDSRGMLGPLEFIKGNPLMVEFVLEDMQKLAFEVAAYAD